MKFIFLRSDMQSPPHSFDLGDISVIDNDIKISSLEDERYKMMIYISIVDLIDSLLETVRTKHSTEFCGTDSSFYLKFKYDGKFIKIERKGISIKKSAHEILKELKIGIDQFLNKENILTQDEACYGDLKDSIDLLNLSISE